MAERRFPQTLIAPGINDERSRAILSAFEAMANAFDFSALLMRRSSEIPDEALPLAIHDFSLSEFVPEDGLPVPVIRKLIDEAWSLHEMQGTDRGVLLGQSMLGIDADVTQWWQENPPAKPHTHVIEANPPQIYEDEPGYGEKTFRAIGHMVDVTKRWSQQSCYRLPLAGALPLRLAGAGLPELADAQTTRIEDRGNLDLRGDIALTGKVELQDYLHRAEVKRGFSLAAAPSLQDHGDDAHLRGPIRLPDLSEDVDPLFKQINAGLVVGRQMAATGQIFSHSRSARLDERAELHSSQTTSLTGVFELNTMVHPGLLSRTSPRLAGLGILQDRRQGSM